MRHYRKMVYRLAGQGAPSGRHVQTRGYRPSGRGRGARTRPETRDDIGGWAHRRDLGLVVLEWRARPVSASVDQSLEANAVST